VGERVTGDPVALVQSWMESAHHAGAALPEAMALATVSADGTPSVRYVLCRGIDERGFFFYTNLDSPKASDLDATHRAAAVFYWDPPGRQVRISGTVEQSSRTESEEYFASRPREHQISAWTSPQSSVVESREQLEQRWEETERRFAATDQIPLPPNCGGFRILPEQIEFWSRGAHRLHDRLRFTRDGDGWRKERLAP
jgi:pyridoxamine 5'-phosphate oxidase